VEVSQPAEIEKSTLAWPLGTITASAGDADSPTGRISETAAAEVKPAGLPTVTVAVTAGPLRAIVEERAESASV
jgi:hypothetical protein